MTYSVTVTNTNDIRTHNVNTQFANMHLTILNQTTWNVLEHTRIENIIGRHLDIQSLLC